MSLARGNKTGVRNLPVTRRIRLFGCRTVSGGAASLRFHTQEEWDEYEKADLDLHMRFYHKQVQRYGVWAGNQGKYVPSPEHFSSMDPRRDWGNYQVWLRTQPKEPT